MSRKIVHRDISAQKLDTVVQTIFDSILMPYQAKWLCDESQFKLCVKSRQIGMSECAGLEALLDILYNKESTIMVSRSQRQSTALMDKFYRWIDMLKDFGIVLPLETQSRTECMLNGCFVRSLSSTALTGEGYSAGVLLDEYGLQMEDEQLYTSLLPTITMGYKMRIISRPFGKSNMFYRIWKNKDNKYPDYSIHKTSIYDAIAQGWKVNLKSLKRNMDNESFAENYLCEPADESTAYFTYELLGTCFDEFLGEVEGSKWIGIDVGRKNDRTAVVVLCLCKDGKYRIAEKKEIKGMRLSDQRYELSELIRKHNPVSVEIDQGTIGFQLAEDLEQEFKGIVHPVSMNDTLKMEAFPKVKSLFEDRKLLIPDEADFLNQVHSIKRDFSTGGITRFWAERNSKGHADVVFALALACHALVEKKRKSGIVLITAKDNPNTNF